MSLPISLSTSGQARVNRVQPIGWTVRETWDWCRAEANGQTLSKPMTGCYPRNLYAGGPLPCGIQRVILFFDTTGIDYDMSLRLYVILGSSTGGLRIVNGNGADYNFGHEIYGWMLGRFSSGYLIASRDFIDMPISTYQYFTIPAAHINSSGYTVLILAHSADYGNAGTPQSGISFNTTNVRLQLSCAGYIWVEGTELAYIGADQTKRTQEGTLEGATGQTAGHLWVEGNNLRYIDSSGDERYITGTLEGATGQTGGHIWIEATKLRYIDSSGDERYIAGS